VIIYFSVSYIYRVVQLL